MKPLRVALLIGMALFVLAKAIPTTGQSGGIIVQGANSVLDVPVSSSPELVNLIVGIGTRFLVEHANSIRYHAMPPIASELQTLLGQVEDRIVIQYANSNLKFAFAYPVGLVADTAPPQISQVAVTQLSPTSVKVSWLSDEYAASSLAYGTQSGTYTQTVTDPLYYKLHETTLTGLTAGGTYYYRLANTDRSGNMFQSSEYNFTLQNTLYLYLPLIRR
jgi:hypothetical protein